MNKAKKIMKYMLCAAFAAILALACITFGANKKAQAAETADDFKVASIGIRLQNDAKETGVRFKINAKADLLNKTDAKVTVYVLPQMFYVDGAHLNAGAVAAQSVELVGEWTNEGENGEYKTAYAYIYDFPANNYGVKLLAEACLTYTDNGATVSKWTAISSANSLTDVAKAARDSDVSGADDYIVNNVKITYKNADGTKIGDQTLAYGETLTYPTLKETDQYLLWKTSKGTKWNSEWVAQGNMTLTAVNYGAMVDASALQISSLSNGSNPYAVPTTEVAAPVGFTKVHKSTTKITGSNMLYSVLNLTNYKTVYFALKTDGTFFLGKTSKEKVEYNGKKWMIFRITHNADGETWDVTVNDEDGKLLVEAKGFKADRNDGMYVANALSTILYGNRNGNEGYICSSDATVLYATEIRADRTDERRKVAPIGEIIKADSADLMLFDEDKIKLGELPSDNADGALYATGFEKIYKSTWHIDNAGWIDRALTDKNVTGDYSEIRFAIMTDRCICYYNTMNPNKTGCLTWWYYTLIRDETTDKWTATVTDEGGRVIATKDNLNETCYGSNSLDSILWGSWGGFRLTNDHTNETEWVVYCTEIRGTLKNA